MLNLWPNQFHSTHVSFIFCLVFHIFTWDCLNSDDGILGGGTSSPVGLIITVDEQPGGFQKKPVKEEEPENDEFLCMTMILGYMTLLAIILSV